MVAARNGSGTILAMYRSVRGYMSLFTDDDEDEFLILEEAQANPQQTLEQATWLYPITEKS